MATGLIIGVIVGLALAAVALAAMTRNSWPTVSDDLPDWERAPKWNSGIWSKDLAADHYIRDDGISVIRQSGENGSCWVIEAPTPAPEADPETTAVLEQRYRTLAHAVETVDNHWPIADRENAREGKDRPELS